MRGRAVGADGFVPAPGNGRCEVICFSSDHTGSFAELAAPQARLGRRRVAAPDGRLAAMPGVEQVFCFENRGEEIGVTLAIRTDRSTATRICPRGPRP